VKGSVGLCACVLLKCTNTREGTAQLETYAVLRHEKEECVYMRKTAREREMEAKNRDTGGPPPLCSSFLLGISEIRVRHC